MSGFRDAVTALSDFVEAYYPGELPVYADPTDDPTPEDVESGWIGLHFDFREQGPTGGRFGPQSSYYRSVIVLTGSIHIPRARGDGPAWEAADQLCNILRERHIGDVCFRSVRVSPAPLDGEDTHHQVDVIALGELEAFFPVDGARLPMTAALFDRISFDAPHGLAVGDVVYRSSTALPKAIATAQATLARGMVAAVVSDYTAVVVSRGLVRWPAHGFAVGAAAYLSTAVAGAITAIEPGAGEWRQRVGSAWSVDEFQFDPEAGELLP